MKLQDYRRIGAGKLSRARGLEKLILRVPGLNPVTLNNAYFNDVGRGRGLTPRARRFKKTVQQYLMITRAKIGPSVFYRLILEWYQPEVKWITKEGEASHHGGDASNMIKLPEDAIFDFLGLKDVQVSKVSSEKVIAKGESYLLATLEACEIRREE